MKRVMAEPNTTVVLMRACDTFKHSDSALIFRQNGLKPPAGLRAAEPRSRSPLTPTSWETSLQASLRMFRSRYVGELRSYRHGNPETAVMSLYSMLKQKETSAPQNNYGQQRRTLSGLPLPVPSTTAIGCRSLWCRQGALALFSNMRHHSCPGWCPR